MLRVEFHTALDETRRLTVEMANVTLGVIKNARAALENADTPEGARAMVSDDLVVDYQARIEAACTEMLWKQQPLATEFRQVAAMLEIADELMRTANNASAIAKRVVKVHDHKLITKIEEIGSLAGLAETMLTTVVGALEAAQADELLDLDQYDEDVEELYNDAIKALQKRMAKDPDCIQDGTQLLFALASLRRICRRTRAVASHVLELVTSTPTEPAA